MASEDERYRQSSQYRLWSFTPASLQDLRSKTNALAQQQIAARLQADPPPDFLSADEEARLVRFFTIELLRAAQFCDLPTEIRATAAVFFRRFYVTNSVMTYPPTELLKTSLFFGCKAEGFYMRLGRLAEKLSGTTAEQILAGEFLLCQGMRFAFDVRHPFRALEGAILEMRRRLPDDEARVNQAHARAREILKFSSLVTDAYFHYTPSQIMMAALQMADAEMVEMLVPGAPSDQSGAGDDGVVGAHTDMRNKILATIEGCRAMLEEEPPERMTQYWGTVRFYFVLYTTLLVPRLILSSETQPETAKLMKPLRKKLQKCRDPDRVDLVALQRARREQGANKDKKPRGSVAGKNSDDVFGGDDAGSRDIKRRKVEDNKLDDPFGPPL